MSKWNFSLLLLFAMLLLAISGCGEDSAADAAKKAICNELGLICDEEELGVDTPTGWYFLFAKDLDETQSAAVDQDFEVSIESALEFLGVSGDDLTQMIAFAKVEDVSGYGNRLRFANKLKYEDGKIKLDTEALEQLGDSIGSSGAGVYAAYFAKEQNGYISGVTQNCSGDPAEGILATASDGPFFTKTAEDGSWALPTLSGKPATINFSDGEDCQGSTAAPSTDTNEEANPKTDPAQGGPDPAEDCGGEGQEPCPVDETPPTDNFSDGTDNVVTEEEVPMEETPPETSISGNRIDFEDGIGDWSHTTTCQFYGVSGDAYPDLFPDGTEANYLYASSGGDNVQSCTLTLTVPVPDGATELEVSYNFLSQEYVEWVGSAFNDMFTVIVQGAPAYLVNRSVNNVATDNDWMDTTSGAAAITGIADSYDAQWNDNGAAFDGMLKWSTSEESNPRGEPENNNQGKTATVPLPDGFTTVTIIVTVSDVADAIYDSAGIIDWFEFK